MASPPVSAISPSLMAPVHPFTNQTIASQRKTVKPYVIASSVGATALVILCFTVVGWRCWNEKPKSGEAGVDSDFNEEINEELQRVAGPKKVSYADLAVATNDFAEDRFLGKGGFGSVYKGNLSNCDVAVKKIDSESHQGIKEYITEITVISRVRHKNLVQLVGWCHENGELLLVYEFMPNRSLDNHLFRGGTLLTWDVRYKIAKDVASAILYLHEDCKPYILHRDVKASNIMLDATFTAKLSDFGLAKLVDQSIAAETTVVAGTLGYLAPEYIYTGKVSKESDMYSFGVILLQIASGRKAIDHQTEERPVNLVEWSRKHHEARKSLDVADPRLGGRFDKKEMMCLVIVGLWCTNFEPGERPSIREARAVLNLEAVPPILQRKWTASSYSPWSPSTSLSDTITASSNQVQNIHLSS